MPCGPFLSISCSCLPLGASPGSRQEVGPGREAPGPVGRGSHCLSGNQDRRLAPRVSLVTRPAQQCGPRSHDHSPASFSSFRHDPQSPAAPWVPTDRLTLTLSKPCLQKGPCPFQELEGRCVQINPLPRNCKSLNPCSRKRAFGKPC